MSATESLYDDNSLNYSELVYTPFLINAAPQFVKKKPFVHLKQIESFVNWADAISCCYSYIINDSQYLIYLLMLLFAA